MLEPNSYVNNRYLIVRRIDGAVYEALDMTSRAQVALKLIVGGGGAEWPQLERGALALRSLYHPLLPATIECFREGDNAFVVSEFVAGEQLAPGLPFEQLTRYAGQLLDVLGYLHRQAPPVLHRSIKPQNVLITPDGQLKLVDLGLDGGPAQIRQARPAGALGSSLQFMPPEQVQGAPLDQRSDLYSLAGSLYYAATGALPALAGKRINARLRGQPDPLQPAHELAPQLPLAWSDALAHALALDAIHRPASAAVFAHALGVGPAPATAESQIPTLVALPPQPAPAQPAYLPPTQTAGAAPPAPTAPSKPRPRWLLPAIISAVGAVLLVVVLALILLRRLAPAAPPIQVQNSTTAPAAAVTSAPKPTAAPAAEAVDNVPDPTAAPEPPRVVSIEPASAQVGAKAITFTLRGTHLDNIRTARLVSESGPPIEVAVLALTAEQAALTVPALTAPLNGEVAYQLEINGETAEAPALALRDFIGRKPVAGVLPEYVYTNRVVADEAGAYTAMRAEADVASQPLGLLRNGDEVDMLRDDVAGWYLVRVHRAADPAQAGVAGWIERWLIDNQEVPPQPTPVPTPAVQVFVGKVYSAPTDGAVQCGTSFASSIYGSVEDARGRGIAGAKLRISSRDGKNVFDRTTGRGGVFSVPGLGCTGWSVRLLSVPNAPGGIRANRVNVTNLNGGQFTAAEVRFRLQP